MKILEFSSIFNKSMYPIWKHLDAPIFESINSLARKIASEKEIVQIAVSGSSGAVIGSLLVKSLIENNCSAKLLYFKKINEQSNHSYPIIHERIPIIIVDDLINSGNTINHIYDQLTFQKDFFSVLIPPSLAILDYQLSPAYLDLLEFKPSTLYTSSERFDPNYPKLIFKKYK